MKDNIGKRMLMYRARHKMSQTEFGKMIGVSKQSISNFETGFSYPGKMTRLRFELLLKSEAVNDNQGKQNS